jgi:hypothetical protein
MMDSNSMDCNGCSYYHELYKTHLPKDGAKFDAFCVNVEAELPEYLHELTRWVRANGKPITTEKDNG